MARYRLTKDKLSFEEYRAKHAAEKANNTNKLPGLDLGNAVAVTTSTVEQPTSYSHGGGGARRDAAHLKQREDERMAEYESIPNYNIVERAADNIGRSVNSIVNPGGGRGSDSKSEQYAKKTELADRYTQIVNKRAGEALANYEPQSDDTLPQLLGQNYSKLTSPVQYRNAMAEITPYLEQYGITPKQLENYIKTKTYAEQNAKMAEYTKEHPFLANAAEVPISVGQSLNVLPSILSYVQGKPIAENTALSELDKLPGTIIGTTGQAIEDNAKTELGGKAGRLAYDVGMGVADNLFRIAATGGSSVGSRVLGAGKAAAGSLANNMDKNTSDAQKVLTSTAAGIISYMTEKAPTENLINNFLTTGSKEASKNFWLNFGKMVAKQAGAEGLEELEEGIANTATDIFVNKSESDYAKSVQAYMSQGMSRDAARNKAANDIAMETAYEALVGALSGGLMGGGESVINNMAYNASRFAPEIDQNYEQYQRNYQGSGNGSVDNAMVGTLDNANELMANNAVSVDDLLNNPYLFNAGRNLGVDESGRLVNQFVAPWTNGVNMNWNEGYLDDGSAELNSNNMRNAMEEDNGRTIPFLDNTDADSDLRRSMNRALELNEGRRMINPYMDSAMDALDAEISEDNALRMNAEEDGRTIRNPYLNWNNGEGQGYQQVTNFENIPQININWNDGSANNTQNLSDELQTAQNQVARFMDQYRTTGNELYRNIADSIQQRINNELGKNAQNSENELTQKAQNAPNSELNGQKSADEAEWARLMAMAPGEVAAQNEQKNAPFLQTRKPKKNSQQRSQVMAEDIGLNPNTTLDETQNTPSDTNQVMAEDMGLNQNNGPKITENENGITLSQKVIRDQASQAAYNTLGRNTEAFQTNGAQRWLMEGIEQGMYDKSLAPNSFGQDVLSNEYVDQMADDLYRENPEKLEKALRNGEAASNPVVWQAANIAMEEAWERGDLDKARYYSMKVQGGLTTPARIMQLASRKSKSTFATAVADTQAIIQKTNEEYFKTRSGKQVKDGCHTLAKALKNIGNDYTQLKGKTIPSLTQTKRGVEAELNREASNIYKQFNDQDKEYIANMINRGYNIKEIQTKLEQKLTTGKWDISDEDLDRVNRLYKFIEDEDPESKTYVDYTEAAAAILAQYIPAKTLNEKIAAWRYMAMLLNPTTHVRNIGSNVVFGQVLENVSDKLAATVESVLHKVDPELYENTKKILPSSRKLKKACGDYLINHKWKSLTTGVDKFMDLGEGVKRQQRTFSGKNAVSKFGQFLIDTSSGTLQWEDEAAMKTRFQQAMAGYLAKNGKGVDIFKSENAQDKELVERAADYAVRRAKEATFHEESQFAKGWKEHSNDWKKRGPVGKAISMGMEGTAPFVSTPANILKMGVRYSPFGFFDGMVKIMSDPNLKKSPAAVTESIENMARGFTGSSIMALGYILASMGMLRGKGKKDEEQLDKEAGKQDYSIRFNLNGDTYNYTLDWAAPFSLPLFVGAELYKTFNDVSNKDGKDILYDVMDVASAIADPMTEMSMLQGFNNALNSASSYAKGGTTAGQAMANIGYGYLSQMIPSMAGKVAKTIDNKQRNTYYTGDNDGTKGMLEKFYKKTANRIPGLSQTLEPFVSALGEEKENSGDSLASKLFLNFLSPGYLSKEKDSELLDEMYRLHGETDKVKNSFPALADATPYSNQPKMSERDFTEWAKTYGQNYTKMETAAINNPKYKSLDADSQAEIISMVKSLANAVSKEEFKSKAQDNTYTFNIDQGFKKQMEAYDYNGIDGVIDYTLVNKAAKDLATEAGRKQASKGDILQAVESSDLSKKDKINYLKIMTNYTKKGTYVEKYLGDEYAYDWFKIEQAAKSDSKTNQTYAILTSGLPAEEQNAFLDMLDLKDSEMNSLLELR